MKWSFAMEDQAPALSDTILFSDPRFPFSIKPVYSNRSYDPMNPSPIFHEELEVKLILDGVSTLMINGVIYTVHPGDIVVINPYEHHYTIDTGTPMATYHLYMMSLDFLRIYNPCAPDLRYKLLGEKVCFQNIIRGDARLQQILSTARTEWEIQGEHWNLILNNLMTEFYVLLLRSYVNTKYTSTIQISCLQNYDSILPAIVYINKFYMQKISVDVLAGLCRFSKSHFCRLFKKVTGQTVVSYINQYRLNLAEHLIRTQNIRTLEIAKRCGFDDLNYFYRVYKKHFGHTCYKQ